LVGSSSFGSLIAPIKRLAGMNIPIPYAPQLEKAAVPQIEDIEIAAREIVKNWR
jgi:pyruvate dehydrogenase E1 component beta subunit